MHNINVNNISLNLQSEVEPYQEFRELVCSGNVEALEQWLANDAIPMELEIAFKKASLAKQWAVAELFLSCGADINFKDDQGGPFLMKAVKERNSEMVAFLLDHKADTSIENNKGIIALECAFAMQNNQEVVDCFIARKLVNYEDSIWNQTSTIGGPNLLRRVYDRGYGALIFHLLKHAVDNGKLSFYKQLDAILYDAVVGHDFALVDLLVKQNISTDFLDGDEGFTPLFAAMLKSNQKMQELLVSVEQDPFHYSLCQEIIERKRVGNFLSIKGSSKITPTDPDLGIPPPIKLLGFSGQQAWASVIEYLPAFFKTRTEFSLLEKEEILAVAKFSTIFQGPEECLKAINTRSIVAINAGWIRHCVEIVFAEKNGKNYLAICNTGEGISEREETIKVYQIDKSKITLPLLHKIVKEKEFMKSEQGIKFYQEELPNAIAIKQKGRFISDKVSATFRSIGSRVQSVGNCAAKAVLAAMRFVFTTVILQPQVVDSGLAAKLGLRVSKAFQDFIKLHIARDFKKRKTISFFSDIMLLKCVNQRIEHIVGKPRNKDLSLQAL